jgi:hypothetical protein
MNLLETYIFKRMVGAFILSLVTLSLTVWMTQALREFDLVTGQGQSIGTFFRITLLLLPGLITIVSPIALLIGVIYTFTLLNNDSELVVINASGAPQKTLLKPVLVLGLVAAAVSLAFVIRMLGYYFGTISEFNPFVIPLLYLLPIGVTVAASILILRGVQLSVSERAVMFFESIFERIGGLVRPPARQTDNAG